MLGLHCRACAGFENQFQNSKNLTRPEWFLGVLQFKIFQVILIWFDSSFHERKYLKVRQKNKKGSLSPKAERYKGLTGGGVSFLCGEGRGNHKKGGVATMTVFR